MEFEKIKELIQLVNNSKIVSFELINGNEAIKMDKSLNRVFNTNNIDTNTVVNNENIELKEIDNQERLIRTVNEESAISKEDLKIIPSPMVGTFYASASPTSESFVKTGDKIKNGTVLCIIEAMKLMNEIESEYTGTIVECLANDGDMVEYGQPLFKYRED